MTTEFRRVILPDETRSLAIFERKAFQKHPSDCFNQHDWEFYNVWWMNVDNQKIGCCALEHNMDFKGQRKGSLYIASTGILPSFQGKGFGSLMKMWQVLYARQHKFNRIVTNTRETNKPMIGLNTKFGFKIIKTVPDYYIKPDEPTVVMELRLK